MRRLLVLLFGLVPVAAFAGSINSGVNLPTRCVPAAAAPVTCGAATQGRCYTNTGDNFLYYCDGTNWTQLTTGAAPTPAPTATPIPTSTPAPTATAVPTFPSTGNAGTQAIYNTLFDNGNSGASKTVNWSTNGPIQKITTTASCTLTFTAPAGPASLTLIIIHEASATSYTYTWPTCTLGTSGVCWPSGSVIATTNTSGARDTVSFKYDGTNYFAVGASNFQ